MHSEKNIKGIVHPQKPKILHLFQTCLSFTLLLNTHKVILKNVGKQELLTSIVRLLWMLTVPAFRHSSDSEYIILCAQQNKEMYKSLQPLKGE